MCFLCLKMKYLGQIGAMLTAPFIQSKSAFASFTALEPPLLFNLAQIKPFVVLLICTDRYSNNIKYQLKIIEYTIINLLLLSNYDQDLIKVGSIS